MTHKLYCHRLNHGGIAESRLMHFAGIDTLPQFTKGGATEMEKFRDWKDLNPGSSEMFDALAENPEVTNETLRDYVNNRVQQVGAGKLEAFEMEISKTLSLIHGPDQQEAIAAEAKMKKLVETINTRNKVLQDAQTNRGAFQKEEELPYVTSKVVKTAKEIMGATYKGFENSSGQEKALMVVGLTAGVLILRALYKSIDPKSPYVRGSIGLVAAVMVAEAVNVTVKKTRGVPLYSFKNGWLPEFPLAGAWRSPENFEEQKRLGIVEKANEELANAGVPKAFINQVGLKGEEAEYAIGINNLADLTIPQFRELYENHRNARQIPDEDPNYSRGAIAEDHLTPRKRFELVYNMGLALGLIDQNSNSLNPIDPHRADKTLMYLMLDWH